jgi:hypothetical protein
MHAIRSGRGKARATGRKPAAWLALFSLFLQLWVTAGHFHPEDFAALFGIGGGGVAVTGAQDDNGSWPSTAFDHDDCALCFSVQLAGNSTLPASPALTGPRRYAQPPTTTVEAFQVTSSRHLLFETRAPPLA